MARADFQRSALVANSQLQQMHDKQRDYFQRSALVANSQRLSSWAKVSVNFQRSALVANSQPNQPLSCTLVNFQRSALVANSQHWTTLRTGLITFKDLLQQPIHNHTHAGANRERTFKDLLQQPIHNRREVPAPRKRLSKICSSSQFTTIAILVVYFGNFQRSALVANSQQSGPCMKPCATFKDLLQQPIHNFADTQTHASRLSKICSSSQFTTHAYLLCVCEKLSKICSSSQFTTELAAARAAANFQRSALVANSQPFPLLHIAVHTFKDLLQQPIHNAVVPLVRAVSLSKICSSSQFTTCGHEYQHVQQLSKICSSSQFTTPY